MKRSKTVTLALVPLFAALALPGCSKPVCVDKTGTVVDQKKCEDEEQRQASQPGVTPFYYWYYMGGSGSSYPTYGSRIGGSGGYYTVPRASNFASDEDGGDDGIGRGGFGDSAVGHGFGGGGE